MPNVESLPSCSAISLALPHSHPNFDPEKLSNFMGAFQKACVQARTGFGALSPNTMGDGALVYLGIRKRTRMTPNEPCAPGLR